MKNKALTIGAIVAIALFAGLGIYGAIHNTEVIKSQNIQIESKTFKLQKLETEFKKLNSDYQQEKNDNTLDVQKEQEYQLRIKDLEDRYRALEVSKAEKKEQNRIAAAASTVAHAIAPTASAMSQCGDNEYAHKIYMQESTCQMDVVNSIGACGLGQSLPCSKLSSVCPNWQNDYDCQNRFFTDYAMKYGGWAEAYAFKYCMGSCYSARINMTVIKNEIYW